MQYVATVGLSLIFLVLFANLLVDLYARGAVRDALDEGVRAAAPAGTDARVCEARADEVLDGLLRGRLGDDIRVECGPDGSTMVARAKEVCRRGCRHSFLHGACRSRPGCSENREPTTR